MVKTLNLSETLQFISYVVDMCFDYDEETLINKRYIPSFKQSAISDMFNKFYLDKDIEKLTEDDYFEYLSVELNEYVNLRQWNFIIETIDEEIEIRKNKLLQPKSAIDEAFELLNGLFVTLNKKAEEMDIKKLEKVLKKLTPDNILKAYQKSGIGESVRDNAIQDQAKTIIELNKAIEELKAKSE